MQFKKQVNDFDSGFWFLISKKCCLFFWSFHCCVSHSRQLYLWFLSFLVGLWWRFWCQYLYLILILFRGTILHVTGRRASDRGNTVDLHVTHRIVALSANHLLFIQNGRVHRAERFESRLQHRGAAQLAFDFSG